MLFRSISQYENWVQNKFRNGYLSKKGATRQIRLDSKSTDDESEDLIMSDNKNFDSMDITPVFIESSKIFASSKLESLITQLDNYSEWKLINNTKDNSESSLLEVYSREVNELRFHVKIHSKDLMKVVNMFESTSNNTIWKNIEKNIIYKQNTSEVIQSIYSPEYSEDYIESIVEREIEEFKNDKEEGLLIKGFSLDLPQTSLKRLKRLNINARVSKSSLRKDKEKKSYVDYQVIWSMNDDYKELPDDNILEN